MANLREFTYPSSDGIHQVHAAEWTPENGAPRAVLQLVHGISEYIMRYDGFARFMADHGFVVVGNDHLGHGGTATGPEEYGFLAEQDGWYHILYLNREGRAAIGYVSADYLALPQG